MKGIHTTTLNFSRTSFAQTSPKPANCSRQANPYCTNSLGLTSERSNTWNNNKKVTFIATTPTRKDNATQKQLCTRKYQWFYPQSDRFRSLQANLNNCFKHLEVNKRTKMVSGHLDTKRSLTSFVDGHETFV